eukprot:Pgem_evm1s7884
MIDEATSTADMMKKANEFYKDLLTANNKINKKNYKNKYKNDFKRLPKLGDDAKRKISKQITEEEIKRNLMKMNGNTSPGLDGIPAKVYQLFWNEIKQILVPLIKQIYNNMRAPENFGQGIIVPIFKKGDKNDLVNYRPITLLNSDYKLFMKIITSRIVPILPSIISPGQTCNVPGRTIEDSIKFMQTTIWDMNRNCDFFSYNQSQILNTDVKKAFDTLEWEFLFTVLEEMGFPEIFISLIKNLYENGSSVVSIN